MLVIREHNRYGKFKANSSIGEVYVELNSYGFGEELKVYTKDKTYFHANNYDEEECWYEDEEFIKFYNERHGFISIQKPFIKCLKRY